MSADKDLADLARFFGQPGEPSWQFGNGDHFDAHATLERLRLAMTAAGNLLAVIHGDGGHHLDEVGWVQACEDAEEAWLARGVQGPDGPVSDHLRARVAAVCQAAIDGDGGCTGPACLPAHQAGELLDAYDDAQVEIKRITRERDARPTVAAVSARVDRLCDEWRSAVAQQRERAVAAERDRDEARREPLGTLIHDGHDGECVKRLSVPLSRVCSRGTAGCNADREEPEEFERMRAWGRENIIAPEDHAAREAIEAGEAQAGESPWITDRHEMDRVLHAPRGSMIDVMWSDEEGCRHSGMLSICCPSNGYNVVFKEHRDFFWVGDAEGKLSIHAVRLAGTVDHER